MRETGTNRDETRRGRTERKAHRVGGGGETLKKETRREAESEDIEDSVQALLDGTTTTTMSAELEKL